MHVILNEWERSAELELSPDQVAALAGTDIVEIRPSAGGRWIVGAQSIVGVFHAAGLEVRIRPKISVGRLLGLLCETIERVEWHDHDTLWSESEDLVTTIAGSFCAQVERVVAQGLLQGYRVVDESIYGVRGRIDIGRQMSRQAGMTLPVEVSYDDYSVDIIENRLLAGANEVLLRLPLPDVLRLRLQKLRMSFVDVAPTAPMRQPPVVTSTRLNARYQAGIVLARIVLRSAAVEDFDNRDTIGTNFRVDMNKVFEDIVGWGLKRHIAAQGWGDVGLQDVLDLDDDGRFKIRPDIVWRRAGQIVAVGDVKYKRPDLDGTKSGDLYQALAYATRFDLDECALIYATPPPVTEIRIGEKRIPMFFVDLELPKAERDAQIELLAESMQP